MNSLAVFTNNRRDRKHDVRQFWHKHLLQVQLWLPKKTGKKNEKKMKKKKIDVQIVISPCNRRLLCMTSLLKTPPFTEHLSHTNLARQLVAQISTSFVSRWFNLKCCLYGRFWAGFSLILVGTKTRKIGEAIDAKSRMWMASQLLGVFQLSTSKSWNSTSLLAASFSLMLHRLRHAKHWTRPCTYYY